MKTLLKYSDGEGSIRIKTIDALPYNTKKIDKIWAAILKKYPDACILRKYAKHNKT